MGVQFLLFRKAGERVTTDGSKLIHHGSDKSHPSENDRVSDRQNYIQNNKNRRDDCLEPSIRNAGKETLATLHHDYPNRVVVFPFATDSAIRVPAREITY